MEFCPSRLELNGPGMATDLYGLGLNPSVTGWVGPLRSPLNLKWDSLVTTRIVVWAGAARRSFWETEAKGSSGPSEGMKPYAGKMGWKCRQWGRPGRDRKKEKGEGQGGEEEGRRWRNGVLLVAVECKPCKASGL